MIKDKFQPKTPNSPPNLAEFLISYGKQAIYLLDYERRKLNFKDPDKDYKLKMIIAIHHSLIEMIKGQSDQPETDFIVTIPFRVHAVYRGIIQLNLTETNHFPPSDIERILGMQGITKIAKGYTEIINLFNGITQE